MYHSMLVREIEEKERARQKPVVKYDIVIAVSYESVIQDKYTNTDFGFSA